MQRYRAFNSMLRANASVLALSYNARMDVDKILSRAAHLIWPTLAPLIQDMLRRKPNTRSR